MADIGPGAIPEEVKRTVASLRANRFEGYIVGGCVRDLLLSRTPNDWDIATDAAPEEIQTVFPDSFYANKFFTVTVKTESADPHLSEIEITTFRAEGAYRDFRHPDDVKPAKTIEEDLSRRDFTVNALALNIGEQETEIIDPFNGRADLEARTIRTVGDPRERFSEDALRMLRAVRLAAELNFAIEEKTRLAIKEHAAWLQAISKERIRDEFSKIVMSGQPLPGRASPAGGKSGEPSRDFSQTVDVPGKPETERSALVQQIGGSQSWIGLELLAELGLLPFVLPELLEGVDCTQNKHHVFTVWEHNMRALDFAAKNNFSLGVRLGALLHDVAKPRAKRGEGPDSTFYGHDVLGAKMSEEILSRLRYPEKLVEKVSKLVRWHLFRYDYEVDEIQTTDSSIRRLIRNIGVENIEELVQVRMCDRIGSGVPKAVPYRLRHFQFRVEKILREHEAVNVSMLQIRGDDVMKILGIEPGPKIGHVLNALMEEVLDDPSKNNSEYLRARAKELGSLSENELKELRERAESRVELLENEREQSIKEKYYVK